MCKKLIALQKMNSDDFLNDSDEFISLYSSKMVTDTFKARLKKIAANKHHLTDAFSNENHEEIFCQKLAKTKSKSSAFIKQGKMNSAINEPIEVVNDDLLDISVVIDNNVSLEDSAEIITECNTRPTRRSERLRKKRGQGSCEPNQNLNFNLDIPTIKRSTRSRKNNEKKYRKQEPLEVILDDSSEEPEADDELNPELSVKVIWKSVNVKKYQIRKFQKLSYIFESLSKEEMIPEDKIILTFNNIRVNRDDTPDSLNLHVYHFLDGGVLSELSNSYQTSNSQNSESSSDFVSLKFQDVNKKIIKLSLNKNEKLKVGMIKCSEQLEIPLSKIKFFFDGELLEPSETPASLGLESEEVIDLIISH